MIQINDLVVVEVPKGSKDPQLGNVNGVFVFHDTKPIGTATRYQLPFPCSIIGLASEVTARDMIDIVVLSKSCNYAALASDYQNLLSTHSLTNPQSDYLFLKRKA